jgi:hypothetical protein
MFNIETNNRVNSVLKTQKKYLQEEDNIDTTVSLLFIYYAEMYATCFDFY